MTPDRIRMDGDDLDEIVLTGMAHLEQTSDGSWCLGLYRPDGSGYQVWLSAKKGPMIVNHDTIDARAVKAG